MPKQKDLKAWKAKRQKIVELRKSGLSMQMIGARYNISRQRVKQILDYEGYQ